MLYTKTSAARILNCKPNHIDSLEISFNSVIIKFKKYDPQIIPKSKFIEAFVQFRKEAAANISVAPHPFAGSYIANTDNENIYYSLKLTETEIDCSCHDYENQKQQLGGGCCKHGYALLSTIGFDSFADYVRSNEVKLLAA